LKSGRQRCRAIDAIISTGKSVNDLDVISSGQVGVMDEKVKRIAPECERQPIISQLIQLIRYLNINGGLK
jgi:hypothetical protein